MSLVYILGGGGAVLTNGSRSRFHKRRARHSGIQLIREIGKLTNLRSSCGFNFTIWVNFTRCRDEIYAGRIIIEIPLFQCIVFCYRLMKCRTYTLLVLHCYMCQMLCITVDCNFSIRKLRNGYDR